MLAHLLGVECTLPFVVCKEHPKRTFWACQQDSISAQSALALRRVLFQLDD